MTLPLRHARIKLSQGRLFWYEAGRGIPLVFLHGAWEDGGQWLPLIEQLSSEFHCLAPDLLGFGESEQPDLHYSIQLQVECLHEYLEALKLRQIYLAGDSLGGWIAASYALQYPQRSLGLILLSPEGIQIKGRNNRWLGDRTLLLPGVAGLLRSLRPLARFWRWQGLDAWLQRYQQLRRSPVACQLLFQRRSSEVKAEMLQERLRSLQPPTLILDTSPQGLPLSQAVASLIPHAKLVTVRDSAGNNGKIDPGNFNAIVLDGAIAQQIRQFATASPLTTMPSR